MAQYVLLQIGHAGRVVVVMVLTEGQERDEGGRGRELQCGMAGSHSRRQLLQKWANLGPPLVVGTSSSR